MTSTKEVPVQADGIELLEMCGRGDRPLVGGATAH